MVDIILQPKNGAGGLFVEPLDETPVEQSPLWELTMVLGDIAAQMAREACIAQEQEQEGISDVQSMPAT